MNVFQKSLDKPDDFVISEWISKKQPYEDYPSPDQRWGEGGTKCRMRECLSRLRRYRTVPFDDRFPEIGG
jgi:hypothetical protein